jgi:calcineurin-like phosphoesterase family protein
MPTKYFATADWHLGHNSKRGGIIDYCKRPFEDTREMDKEVIGRYNDTVDENSVVFDIGDLSMIGPSRVQFYEALVKRLRPVKARHLILGNHDELKPQTYVNIGLYTTVHTFFWMDYADRTICMAHDPAIYQPAIYDKIMFCGHIHNLFKNMNVGAGIFNVGVDVRDFRPVSFEELLEEERNL